MTEQIIALAIAMGSSESQREVLEPLCAAGGAALTAQLRPGVTPESCADAFMVCAAWMALDGLSAAGGSGEVTPSPPGMYPFRPEMVEVLAALQSRSSG